MDIFSLVSYVFVLSQGIGCNRSNFYMIKMRPVDSLEFEQHTKLVKEMRNGKTESVVEGWKKGENLTWYENCHIPNIEMP